MLAPGLSAVDRAVTADALPLLGFATVLQLWAAGAATLLAIRDRFTTVAASYVGGSAAGLATYLALERTAGELVLAWSMLAMAIVTCAIMLSGLRGSGGLGGALPRLAAVPADIAVVFGRTAIYLAVNMLFVITLAAASQRPRATRPSCPTPTCSRATWWPAPAWRSACRGSPT